MSDDICGSDDTTSGEPCGFTPGDSCPYHNTDDPPDNGRPTKLTYERQENVAAMIEQGHSITAAARANGVHRETIHNWMKRGEQQDEGVFADFFDRLTRAQGTGEQQYVAALIEIAKENDDTATLMSMLKQRYPESWGDVDRGEQSTGVNVHLDSDDVTEIDPETLEVVDDE